MIYYLHVLFLFVQTLTLLIVHFINHIGAYLFQYIFNCCSKSNLPYSVGLYYFFMPKVSKYELYSLNDIKPERSSSIKYYNRIN